MLIVDDFFCNIGIVDNRHKVGCELLDKTFMEFKTLVSPDKVVLFTGVLVQIEQETRNLSTVT